MEVRYRLTREEFVEMALREIYRQMPPKSGIYLVCYFIGILSLLAVLLITNSILYGLISAVAVPLLLVLAYRKFLRVRIEQLYSAIKTEEETHARIDALGLSLERSHMRFEVNWEAIESLFQDDLGFYLKPMKSQSIYVPRRVFAAADSEQFWSLANAYLAHARSNAIGEANV